MKYLSCCSLEDELKDLNAMQYIKKLCYLEA